MIDRENELPPDASQQITASAPSPSTPRLGQLMLLIAAVAIGIVGIRNCDSQMRAMQIDRRNLVSWFVLLSPWLMSLAVSLMAAGLLPPRSRLSELCRQLGFTACWVTTLVMAIDAVCMFAMNPDSLTNFDKLIRCFSYVYFWQTTGQVGFGVLIAWTTLAFAGCWRSEPSWIDRMGRVLGVVWIIAFVADRFAWLLWLP